MARRLTEHNYDHGLRWRTPVPAEVRAQIRTQVADEMFVRQHGRPPLDDRERAGFLAQDSRQQTKAVAGYDLTFIPVKSVPTLWARAAPDVAVQVEDAHHAAVEKTLAYLEREALFTRRGPPTSFRRGTKRSSCATATRRRSPGPIGHGTWPLVFADRLGPPLSPLVKGASVVRKCSPRTPSAVRAVGRSGAGRATCGASVRRGQPFDVGAEVVGSHTTAAVDRHCRQRT